MALALTLLLWGFAVVAGLLALLLVLPVRLEVRVRKDAGWQVAARVRPFGRFGPGIPVSRPSRRSDKAKAQKPRGKRRRRSRGSRITPAAVFRLIRDILALIELDRLRLDARIGTGDPADTGQVFGLLLPLRYAVSGLPRASIRIEPDFERRALTGACDLDLSLVPIRLVGPAFRFGQAALWGAT